MKSLIKEYYSDVTLIYKIRKGHYGNIKNNISCSHIIGGIKAYGHKLRHYKSIQAYYINIMFRVNTWDVSP